MENNRHKVLLIEDERLYRQAFMRFIEEEKLPYDCTEANSASQAHSILSSESFDIIVADYSLGDGTAFDIFDLADDTPIIIVTAVGDEKIAIEAWKRGAYDYLIKDFEGNYLRAIPITIQNAINHKKAKEQVQLLTGAVMSSCDSIFITDMQNNIVFVNRAFCDTYGYEKEEVIGKNTEIFCKEQPSNLTADSVRQDLSKQDLTAYHTRKDGSEFPVSLSLSPIKDENGKETAIVGVARDISERVFIEDQINALNTKLKAGIRGAT